MNIILCGMPMSGKTSAGRLLADTLGRPFIDSDAVIEAAYMARKGYPRTCREIYRAEGEPLFREEERMALAVVCQAKGAVIALGGGSLDSDGSGDALTAIGTLVYLKAAPEELWERLTARGPLPAYLHDSVDPWEAFLALIRRRRPVYERHSKTTVDTKGMTPENIAAAIVNVMGYSKWPATP